ncbi:hypothetical protein JST97_12135 [bacterium]|nr:hypothetical protein [bacterium]
MLKKILIGMIMLTGFASADQVLELRQNEILEGTFQGRHMGQILMRTPDGRDLEVPSMAVFWYSERPVIQSQLQVGDNLRLCLPDGMMVRVINPGEPQTLGNYEGIHRVPSNIVGAWDTRDIEAANR